MILLHFLLRHDEMNRDAPSLAPSLPPSHW